VEDQMIELPEDIWQLFKILCKIGFIKTRKAARNKYLARLDVIQNRPQRVETPLLSGHDEDRVGIEGADEFAILIYLPVEAIGHFAASFELTNLHAVDGLRFPARVPACGHCDVVTPHSHALRNLAHHLLH